MTPPVAGNKYIVTKEEIADIEALGFAITASKTSLVEVLREYFPGFQLGEYLHSIDDLLSPLTEVKIEKELAYFENENPMLLIQYFSEDEANDETGLGFSRAFIRYPDQLIIDHDSFRIPLTARRQGIGKQMLNISLQQYLRAGVDKIRLTAGSTNGGYVWAKAFFVATVPSEVKVILDLAEKKLTSAQFKFVKRVYENYYSVYPEGKAFPMVKWSALPGMDVILSESEWQGELDLNNPDVLSKFRHYVA